MPGLNQFSISNKCADPEALCMVVAGETYLHVTPPGALTMVEQPHCSLSKNTVRLTDTLMASNIKVETTDVSEEFNPRSPC